jgi:hypothetical protein
MNKLNIVANKIMKSFSIVAFKITKFRDVNESLVGNSVVLQHSKYPPVQDVIVKVKKMPGIKTKQIIFDKSQPILIRDGDKFTIGVVGKSKIAGYNQVDVDFASGQEPDGLDEEFATTFDVSFNISDKDLARLLGVQERVLDKKMQKMDSKTLLSLLARNNKIQRELNKLVTPYIKREFHSFYINEMSDSEWVGFKITDVEMETDDFSYWSAVISPNKKGVRFEVTYAVLGRFF